MNNIDKLKEERDNLGFASEMLKSLKETIKRQYIIILLLICAIVIQFSFYTYERLQYDYVSHDESESTYNYTQTGEGFNNIVINSEEVYSSYGANIESNEEEINN